MSEGLPEYHLNHFAANEVETQLERARTVIERLAAHLAATDEGRDPDVVDLVEQAHIRQAAEFLFGSADIRSLEGAGSGKCVFISYSFDDEAFVSELSGDLDLAGISHFKANRDIRPTVDWSQEIWEAIRGCRVFLPILTPRFLESDWCKFEAGAACAAKKKVLPVLRYVKRENVPEPFGRFQSAAVENREQLSELVEELKRLCT